MAESRWTIVVLQEGRAARYARIGQPTLTLASSMPLVALSAAFAVGFVMAPPVSDVSAAAPTGSDVADELIEDIALPSEEVPDYDEGDEAVIVEELTAMTDEEVAPPSDEESAQPIPALVTGGTIPPPSGRDVLRLRSLADNATFHSAPFDEDGEVTPEALAAIAYVMRAHRPREERHDIAPRLVRVLHRISGRYRNRYIRLASGYRTAGHGTSHTSYHTRGMAADIRIEGVSAEQLYETATDVGAFGVGVYPTEGFVHVDVRSVPHRWQHSPGGDNLPRPHPSRWRMVRTFGEFLRL